MGKKQDQQLDHLNSSSSITLKLVVVPNTILIYVEKKREEKKIIKLFKRKRKHINK